MHLSTIYIFHMSVHFTVSNCFSPLVCNGPQWSSHLAKTDFYDDSIAKPGERYHALLF